MRFGVLPAVLAIFVSRTLGQSLLTTDLSAWYASGMLTTLAVVLAITFWSFRLAIGTRQVWTGAFLER